MQDGHAPRAAHLGLLQSGGRPLLSQAPLLLQLAARLRLLICLSLSLQPCLNTAGPAVSPGHPKTGHSDEYELPVTGLSPH